MGSVEYLKTHTLTEYRAVHVWVMKQLGKPNFCEDCGTTEPATSYDWANVTGEYKRDLSDWQRKCHRCHMRADKYKEMCKKGHPLTGDNLYVRNQGHRYCRACHRIRNIAWMRAHKKPPSTAPRGFAADRDRASRAGKLGGSISRRTYPTQQKKGENTK